MHCATRRCRDGRCESEREIQSSTKINVLVQIERTEEVAVCIKYHNKTAYYSCSHTTVRQHSNVFYLITRRYFKLANEESSLWFHTYFYIIVQLYM